MRILIAEDESELRRVLVTALKMNKYEVDEAEDGVEAVELADEHSYDCMIFDIMMPRKDGIEALQEIRASGDVTPVLLLTAKAEVDDRIKGLDAGADDYLTKPFALGELLARVRSLTRRSEEYTPRKLTIGDVTLDTEQQELKAVNSIRLGNKESRMMEYLILNQDKEIPTEQIFEKVWGDDEDAEIGLVWVYISYLRQKLNAITGDVVIDGEEGGSFCLHVAARSASAQV